MLFNQVRLTLIAFFSYMVMSGLLTQAGVILNAVAATLQLPPAVAVSRLGYLSCQTTRPDQSTLTGSTRTVKV